MIGVLAEDYQKEVVEEFFELFKTPWEYYNGDADYYDAVLVTAKKIPEVGAKLLVVYGSEINDFDRKNNISLAFRHNDTSIILDGRYLPVHGKLGLFGEHVNVLLRESGTDEAAGIAIKTDTQTKVRIGFDLFEEIRFLLVTGQPANDAGIPTLEMHIAVLRDMILSAGIRLLEIPPVPGDYAFITCLTHDVDFIGIRRHKFDHTLAGFIVRALPASLIKALKGRLPWKYFLKNCKAVLVLPLVYLRIADDFWINFEKYLEIEKNLCSTFFFIPYNGRPGKTKSGRVPRRRAAKYDLDEIAPVIKKLEDAGCEIGLHGIDAWLDTKSAVLERERLARFTKHPPAGVRMHWLYFDEQTHHHLEAANFFFDSTVGYNDAVGYKAGTTQVYRPLGREDIFELPLNVQDSALFYYDRMGLDEKEAKSACRKLIKTFALYGGVLTINWHQRSLSPERLWKNFYVSLIDELKQERVWFARASEVVAWFRKRRRVAFEKARDNEQTIKIRFGGEESNTGPPLVARIYETAELKNSPTELFKKTYSFSDRILSGNEKFEIRI